MKHTRIELIKKALDAIETLIQKYPDEQPLNSVKIQLQYLLDIEENKRKDYCRLNDIIIGIITVREIEGLDMEVANLMYDVTAEVDKMKVERKV